MYSYIFKHSEPMNAKRMKDKEEMLCEYFHQWINAFMPFALCAVTNQQTMFTYRAHTSCFNFYVSSHRVKRCSLFAFIFLLLLLTCFLSLSFFFWFEIVHIINSRWSVRLMIFHISPEKKYI